MYLFYKKHQTFLWIFFFKLQKFTLIVQNKYVTLYVFLPRMSKTSIPNAILYKDIEKLKTVVGKLTLKCI